MKTYPSKSIKSCELLVAPHEFVIVAGYIIKALENSKEQDNLKPVRVLGVCVIVKCGKQLGNLLG